MCEQTMRDLEYHLVQPLYIFYRDKIHHFNNFKVYNSVALSTFTKLYNQQHYLIQITFITPSPKQKPKDLVLIE